jgi:hypothetical protein
MSLGGLVVDFAFALVVRRLWSVVAFASAFTVPRSIVGFAVALVVHGPAFAPASTRRYPRG